MTARIPLYVFGAGGHGKVVADAALAMRRFELRGFIDDDERRHRESVLAVPVVGGLEAIEREAAGVAVALGIGANAARIAAFARVLEKQHSVFTVVHPSAVIASGVRLGDGTFVAPLAVIHTDAHTGRACIVNCGAVVEHDNRLGDGVHVSPNAALGGNVTLGDEVHVGLGAVVLPGVSVGARSVIGAGAVVVADVAADVTVVGVPARRLR